MLFRSGNVLVTALLVLLAACQGAPVGNREAGAIGGAALGAGLGAIVGNQVGNPGAGLAIGAAAGALSGALIGDAQDGQEEQLQIQEETLRRQDEEVNRQRREIEDLRRQQYHNDSFKKYDSGKDSGATPDSFSF